MNIGEQRRRNRDDHLPPFVCSKCKKFKLNKKPFNWSICGHEYCDLCANNLINSSVEKFEIPSCYHTNCDEKILPNEMQKIKDLNVNIANNLYIYKEYEKIYLKENPNHSYLFKNNNSSNYLQKEKIPVLQQQQQPNDDHKLNIEQFLQKQQQQQYNKNTNKNSNNSNNNNTNTNNNALNTNARSNTNTSFMREFQIHNSNHRNTNNCVNDSLIARSLYEQDLKIEKACQDDLLLAQMLENEEKKDFEREQELQRQRERERDENQLRQEMEDYFNMEDDEDEESSHSFEYEDEDEDDDQYVNRNRNRNRNKNKYLNYPIQKLSENDINLRQNDDSKKSCSICMEEFCVNDSLRRLACFHDFHQKCVDLWLNKKPSCPICRHKI